VDRPREIVAAYLRETPLLSAVDQPLPFILPEEARFSGRLAAAAEMPIAIERPSGLIVDALVAAGHHGAASQFRTANRRRTARPAACARHRAFTALATAE
jgi:hypothetical protein